MYRSPLRAGDDTQSLQRPRELQRLTLACAGTTPRNSATRWWDGGSPPRARGRRPRRGRSTPSARFTPACAGTTHAQDAGKPFDPGSPPRARGRLRWPPRSRGWCTVHPRVRGDDMVPRCFGAMRTTVHPRVRGDDRTRRRMTWDRRRFTPACAGTTEGEKLPPAFELRFTPACAGTTPERGNAALRGFGSPPRARGRRPTTCSPSKGSTVHPRVPGDDHLVGVACENGVRFTPACAGTTVQHVFAGGDGVRFTPACAGTTLGSPSVCSSAYGSPPRARGRRHRRPGR